MTPFTADGAHVDHEKLRELAEWQIQEGINGLVVVSAKCSSRCHYQLRLSVTLVVLVGLDRGTPSGLGGRAAADHHDSRPDGQQACTCGRRHGFQHHGDYDQAHPSRKRCWGRRMHGGVSVLHQADPAWTLRALQSCCRSRVARDHLQQSKQNRSLHRAWHCCRVVESAGYRCDQGCYGGS